MRKVTIPNMNFVSISHINNIKNIHKKQNLYSIFFAITTWYYLGTIHFSQYSSAKITGIDILPNFEKFSQKFSKRNLFLIFNFQMLIQLRNSICQTTSHYSFVKMNSKLIESVGAGKIVGRRNWLERMKAKKEDVSKLSSSFVEVGIHGHK